MYPRVMAEETQRIVNLAMETIGTALAIKINLRAVSLKIKVIVAVRVHWGKEIITQTPKIIIKQIIIALMRYVMRMVVTLIN